MQRVTLATGTLLLAALMSPVAQAAHGTKGLWRVTVTVNEAANAFLTPQQRAQMQAHGIDIIGPNSIAADHCMTEAEVESNRLSKAQDVAGCSLQDQSSNGPTLRGKLVCIEEPKGTGHLQITYANPKHYTGSMVFSGMANGRSVHLTYHYDGRWLSPHCGKLKQ
ncbi:MAG: DUF3617 domain-containing protein [Alphaproteobacteria bacterium]|nr:DUF3617 domain-containing protein [Alphaproteobacteria bacterium]